jgi:hypothetical protein
MKRHKRFIAVISGLLVFATVIYSYQQGTALNNLLDRQVNAPNLEEVTASQAALNTLISAGAPGGIATSLDCSTPETYTFKPSNSSLRAVLESIVSTDTQYEWEIKDGVINVIPRSGEPQFLSTHIPKLKIKEETINEALSKLLEIPEVRQLLPSLGRRYIQTGVYPFNSDGSPPKEAKKISVSLKDVTVREALNAIARKHGSVVWMFTQKRCGEAGFFSIQWFGDNQWGI